MVAVPRFQETVRTLLRERLLEAAAEVVAESGWAALRMSDVADRVGVSRQTVYNELGSRPALAEALVRRETERFLTGVGAALDSRRDDIVAAVVAAAEYTLRTAARNALLRAVLTGGRGTAEDLLPLITTRSEPIIASASAMLRDDVRLHWPDLGLGDEELTIALDAIVRLAVSHIVVPLAAPEVAARRLGWLVERMLGGGSRAANA